MSKPAEISKSGEFHFESQVHRVWNFCVLMYNWQPASYFFRLQVLTNPILKTWDTLKTYGHLTFIELQSGPGVNSQDGWETFPRIWNPGADKQSIGHMLLLKLNRFQWGSRFQ